MSYKSSKGGPKPNVKMPSAKAKPMAIPKGKAAKKGKPLKGGLKY